MTGIKHRISAGPFRLFCLWGGFSALIVFAALVALRGDPGLADLLFWLIAVWMVTIRFAEIVHVGKEARQTRPKELRKWQRYSVKSPKFGPDLMSRRRARRD